MNLLNILSEIEKVDPEVYGRLDSRRRVFRHLSGLGGRLAVAAVPLALGSIFNKAYAGATATQATVLEVLNYALLLEHLEANFYNLGTGSLAITSALSANNVKSLNAIKTDENNHVAFLRGVISAAPFNATPVSPAATDFDFTGAQGGPRAALNIHSVEARHAARVRTMRRGGLMPAGDRASFEAPGPNPSTSPKSWVSGRDGNGPAPGKTDAVYGPGTPASGTANTIFFPAENNVTQAGVNISTLLTTAAIPSLLPANVSMAASEAFDEPLDMATVKAIARNFVKAGTPTFALLS